MRSSRFRKTTHRHVKKRFHRPIRRPELERRHQASAKFSQMMLLVLKLLREAYESGRNITVVLPAIMAVMAVQLNDYRRRPPISIHKLASLAGLSYETARRKVKPLKKYGAIMEINSGFVGNDAFLEARIDAKYFKRIVRVICAAANVFKKLK